jgi:hypothetical protein
LKSRRKTMSDIDSGEREMTLDEWCCKLPYTHRVNIELWELRGRAVSVPDICWDDGYGGSPDEMAGMMADNLQNGESDIFEISCAKALTNRVMRVSVSYESDVTWEWDKLPGKDDEF